MRYIAILFPDLEDPPGALRFLLGPYPVGGLPVRATKLCILLNPAKGWPKMKKEVETSTVTDMCTLYPNIMNLSERGQSCFFGNVLVWFGTQLPSKFHGLQSRPTYLDNGTAFAISSHGRKPCLCIQIVYLCRGSLSKSVHGAYLQKTLPRNNLQKTETEEPRIIGLRRNAAKLNTVTEGSWSCYTQHAMKTRKMFAGCVGRNTSLALQFCNPAWVGCTRRKCEALSKKNIETL